MKISGMMPVIALCVMMCLFSVFCVSAAEVLLNPGFESWSGGLPDSWTTTGSPTGITITEETTTIHAGTRSAKLEWTNTDAVWIQQSVPINGGTDYSYSCWVYDNDANGRVRLYIRFRNIGGSLVGTALSSSYSVDSTSWQELTIATSAAPADAVSAEFQLRCYDESGWAGSAVAYMDDASMQGDTSDTTPPVDILIRSIDQDSIEITFNEDVEQTSSETTTNYSVDNSVGNPSSATRDSTDHAKVTLDFPSSLPKPGALTITINGVADLNSNPTSSLTAKFLADIRSPGEVDSVNTPNGDQVYQDAYATVRGIVIATEFYPQNINIAGSISGDGIEVRNNSGPISGVARGDQVVVAGKIAQYNGLAQLQAAPIYINVESSGNPEPAPLLITLNAVTNVDEEGSNAFSGESYEGSLVELRNVRIGYLMGNDRTGGSYDADQLWDPDANYEILSMYDSGVLRIYSGTDIDGTAIPPIPLSGDVDTVFRGILKQFKTTSPYNSGYSICPRSQADLIVNVTAVQSPWNLYD
jgi:hypothetical protein